MSSCVGRFGPAAHVCFVVALEKLLDVKLSQKQVDGVYGLLGEFEELKFLQTGVRASVDSCVKDGGC
jgi:hypothetical protein